MFILLFLSLEIASGFSLSFSLAFNGFCVLLIASRFSLSSVALAVPFRKLIQVCYIPHG